MHEKLEGRRSSLKAEMVFQVTLSNKTHALCMYFRDSLHGDINYISFLLFCCFAISNVGVGIGCNLWLMFPACLLIQLDIPSMFNGTAVPKSPFV